MSQIDRNQAVVLTLSLALIVPQFKSRLSRNLVEIAGEAGILPSKSEVESTQMRVSTKDIEADQENTREIGRHKMKDEMTESHYTLSLMKKSGPRLKLKI